MVLRECSGSRTSRKDFMVFHRVLDISMKLVFVVSLLFVSSVYAGSYTANQTSTVTWVKTYSANETRIYFALASMPSDTQCSANYFALPQTLTEKQRDRYFSMLLMAKVSQTTVSVGYDNETGDCLSGRPIIHALSIE